MAVVVVVVLTCVLVVLGQRDVRRKEGVADSSPQL